jgi:acyl-CoA hydrolase
MRTILLPKMELPDLYGKNFKTTHTSIINTAHPNHQETIDKQYHEL